MGQTKAERKASKAWNEYENHLDEYNWMAFTVDTLLRNAFLAGFFAGYHAEDE
jgi:hypothetical protein